MDTIPYLGQLELTRKTLEVSLVTHMQTSINSTHPITSPPHPTRKTRKTRIFPIYAYYTRITSTRKDSKKTRSFCSNTYGNDYQLNSPTILPPTPTRKLEVFQLMNTIPELRQLEKTRKKLEVILRR